MRNQSNWAAAILALFCPFLLVCLACDVFADDKENEEAAKVLEGEWEVVEMIFKGKLQDFGGRPERMKFSKGKYWHEFGPGDDGEYRFGKFPLCECTIHQHGIDLKDKFSGSVSKVLYQVKDGRLWFCCNEIDPAALPPNFGANTDTNLTLRILKRVEKPSK